MSNGTQIPLAIQKARKLPQRITVFGSGNTAEVARGNGVDFRVIIYDSAGAVADLSDLSTLSIAYMPTDRVSAAIASQTESVDDATFTEAQFSAGTHQHATFSFSETDMNPTLTGLEGEYWFVCWGIASVGGGEITQGGGTIKIIEDGTANAVTSPDAPDVGITSAQATALINSYLDTDETLAADSDSKIPTQQAVKAFVEATASGDAWSDAVDSNIVPDANGTRDLGESGTRFNDIFALALNITNNLTVGGTVDGRDIETDGIKLDTIEPSADVTDAGNVTSSGAVMADGSGNDMTGDLTFTEKADHSSTPAPGKGYLWVKNDSPSKLIYTDDAGTDYDLTASASGGDAWGDAVDSNIVPDANGTRDLGESGTRFNDIFALALNITNNLTVGGTVDGRDIETDGIKLDTIEPFADVTDAANVTSSGAVMADGSGNDMTGDLTFTEKADHSSTPAAGKGYLWVKNDSPCSLIFTKDNGVDVDLTAAAAAGALKADGSVAGTARQELLSLNLTDPTELTIDGSGEITRTQGFHTIDTFGDASSSTLQTINGGVTGDHLFIKAQHASRRVVVSHTGGNILNPTGKSITLSGTNIVLELVYDGSHWIVTGPPISGIVAFDAYNTDVSAPQVLTTTPVTATGSSVTHTARIPGSKFHYEYGFTVYADDTGEPPLVNAELFQDGVEVTEAKYNFFPNGNNSGGYMIVQGTLTLPTSGSTTILVKASEHGTSQDTKLHEVSHWDGSLQDELSRPHVKYFEFVS